MSQYQLQGMSTVLSNLEKAKRYIKEYAKDGLFDAADVLKFSSILNLQQRVGTGFTGISWGKSIDGSSIRNETNWSTTKSAKGNVVKLTCNSPHAAVVEIGGLLTGTRYIVSKSGKAMPVGKQQGNIQYFSPRVTMQRGYFYMTDAIHSPNTQSEMLKSIANNIRMHMPGVI